jgi:hypothetical protein
LRIVPVDPVADAAQSREVAQALVLDGSAGHPSDRATSRPPLGIAHLPGDPPDGDESGCSVGF